MEGSPLFLGCTEATVSFPNRYTRSPGNGIQKISTTFLWYLTRSDTRHLFYILRNTKDKLWGDSINFEINNCIELYSYIYLSIRD